MIWSPEHFIYHIKNQGEVANETSLIMRWHLLIAAARKSAPETNQSNISSTKPHSHHHPIKATPIYIRHELYHFSLSVSLDFIN
jgi:hypothetical protein